MAIKLKSILASLLVIELTLLILPCHGPSVAYADSETQGVMVNVVYDDSGSMVRDNNDTSKMIERWSQAKYAMEVFCAMLGPSDVMNIYPMSQNGACGLTLSGNDINRVSAVHGMDGVGDTPFVAVTSAASDLMGADGSYEKWLVVITDGEFNDAENPAVQNALNGYNEAGINTVFLGIGDAAPTLSGNEEKGGYAEKASDGSAVLEKVTGIANQIFSHQVLSESHITTSSGGATLSLDIPVSQLVIFAQGNDASIGDVSLNGNKLEPSLLQNVRYSDIKPLGYENAIADESLIGVLAVFDADESPFEKGSYTVEVTGSAGVEYYYTPGVTVNCDLIQNGAIVNKEDKLYAGDYEISLNYVDPLNGEATESDLLPMDGMSLTLENNQETRVIEGTVGQASLVEGAVSLRAMAELPGHVFLTSEKTYKVLPDPIDLGFAIEKSPDYQSEDLAKNDCEPVIVSARKGESGSPLSEEEWRATDITISNSGPVEWTVEPGENVGTWELTPSAKDTHAIDNALQFDIEGTYQIGDQYAYGASRQTVSAQLTIADMIKKYLPLAITILTALLLLILYAPKKRFSSKALRKLKPTCYWEDKDIEHRKPKVKVTLASRLIPLVPHKAQVFCSDRAAGCDFPTMTIEAAGKGRFRIVNYSAMASSAKIRGMDFEDEKEIKKLKKRDFSFGGFYLTGFDKRGNEQGTFRFR